MSRQSVQPNNFLPVAFYIPEIYISVLFQMQDVFVLEFASLLLSELTKETGGCEQLLSADIVGVIFNRMKNCPDPDVQINSLQVGPWSFSMNHCRKVNSRCKVAQSPGIYLLTIDRQKGTVFKEFKYTILWETRAKEVGYPVLDCTIS